MPQSVADGITAKINGVCLHIIAAFYILAEIYLMVRAYKPDVTGCAAMLYSKGNPYYYKKENLKKKKDLSIK